MGSFGKVKIDTIKHYLKKLQTSNKKEESPIQTHHQKHKRNEGNLKAPSIQEKVEKDKPTPARMRNPKKIRLDIPLIKQHISILVHTYAKTKNGSEIYNDFFEGR